MPIIERKGAASSQGFGEFLQMSGPIYIEDVFSTYIYTGNGTTQSIVNGINLSAKGGMVWNKSRSNTYQHCITDTARGAGNSLDSSSTAANDYSIARLSAFNADGFTMGGNSRTNASSATYVGWSFRFCPKFFIAVPYNGNGSNRTIAHSLGSTPGCIFVKRLDSTGNWQVYHNSLTSASYGIQLNATSAESSDSTLWNSTAPTSSVFSLGTNSDVNASGGSYIAYLFAHNAGGFGLTGTDNVISCGGFATDGSGNATITLGYEPQFIIHKRINSTSDWKMLDSMRGIATGGVEARLLANLSDAEDNIVDEIDLTATGFLAKGLANSSNYIYIAVRAAPMKIPTIGTTVFTPLTSSSATGTTLTTNFPVDMLFTKARATTGPNPIVDRLRGVSTNSTEQGNRLYTNSTAAQSATSGESLSWDNVGFQIPSNWGSVSSAYYAFRRAPSFFTLVDYSGTGSATTFNHNLGIPPELMIVKRTNTTGTWRVYASGLTSSAYALAFNTTAAESSLPTVWDSTAPTSSVFSVGTSSDSNASGSTYSIMLFATCPRVSKVGSYSGNGSTQTINCGFSGGARFVLIKRIDSTGDWYMYDTARGMTSLTDPYMLANSTAAETATLGSVTTVTTGFALDASVLSAINTSGATYIFLAIS